MPTPTASVIKNEVALMATSPRGASIFLIFAALAIASYAQILWGSPLFGPPQTTSTAAPIMEYSVYFLTLGLPFVGVIVGFDLVSDGLESNRFSLLLSHPLSRTQLFFGKLLGRFILMIMPMYVSSAVLLLLFAGPLNSGMAEDFVTAMLVLTLGALFWLGLCVTISAFARRTFTSLISCFTAVFLLAYQWLDLIPNAIVSVLFGRLVVPNQGYPDSPVYLMQIYLTELMPGSQLQPIPLLFQAQSVTSWLLEPAAGVGYMGIGLQVYVLLVYIGALTTLFIVLGAYRFSRIVI